MRRSALPATPLRRRAFAWLLALLLLGAQALAAFHGIAQAQRLMSVSGAQTHVPTDVAEASALAWGHDDDSGWRCRTMDHTLGADVLVGVTAISCALQAPEGLVQPLLSGATELRVAAYGARAPPWI